MLSLLTVYPKSVILAFSATKADNVVEVFSLDEAEEIVKCIITENTNGLNNKVKSYNVPMFLTASLILPR